MAQRYGNDDLCVIMFLVRCVSVVMFYKAYVAVFLSRCFQCDVLSRCIHCDLAVVMFPLFFSVVLLFNRPMHLYIHAYMYD